MKTKIIVIIILVACLIQPHPAQAAQFVNARSLAMANSFTSLARNYQTIGVNPANLALSGNSGFSLELASAGAELFNNSFSLSDYNSYNGAYLSQADKDDILAKIPSGGLEGNGGAGASALSFSRGSFAFGVTGEGGAQACLDKQVMELIFNGNTIGDSVDVSNAYGTGVAHADLNLSYGAKLMTTAWGQINWGINLKYIRGFAYMNVEESKGYVATRLDGISSEGAIQVKTSEGGSGFGMDLGFSAEYKNSWIFSLAVTDMISSISWNKNNELNTYIFTWNSLSLENSDDDSTITSDEIEETIGSFSSSLAPQLSMGASRNYKSLLLSFDYRQGFKNLGNVSTTPEIALGCEARFINSLPLRAGISLGGVDGKAAAVGLGLQLKPFFLDFAYMASGSIIPAGGKGIGLAVSSGLIF